MGLYEEEEEEEEGEKYLDFRCRWQVSRHFPLSYDLWALLVLYHSGAVADPLPLPIILSHRPVNTKLFIDFIPLTMAEKVVFVDKHLIWSFFNFTWCAEACKCFRNVVDGAGKTLKEKDPFMPVSIHSFSFILVAAKEKKNLIEFSWLYYGSSSILYFNGHNPFVYTEN